MTNTRLLEARIREKGLKKGYLAEQLGVSRTTFTSLIRNKTAFKVSQVQKLCSILDIEDEETLRAIFFTENGA